MVKTVNYGVISSDLTAALVRFLPFNLQLLNKQVALDENKCNVHARLILSACFLLTNLMSVLFLFIFLNYKCCFLQEKKFGLDYLSFLKC